MAIFDLFSKRQRALNGELPDVYVYDRIPGPLRVQIVQILVDALGLKSGPYSHGKRLLQHIHDTLCHEYGVFYLVPEGEIRGPILSTFLNFFYKPKLLAKQ